LLFFAWFAAAIFCGIAQSEETAEDRAFADQIAFWRIGGLAILRTISHPFGWATHT